jgi:hypothetical protein
MNWVNGYDNGFESGSRPIGSDPCLTGWVSPFWVGCAFERWGGPGRLAGPRRRLAGPLLGSARERGGGKDLAGWALGK